MNILTINSQSAKSATEALRGCCGAAAWCQHVAEMLPLDDLASFHRAADVAFDRLTPQEWIEAFSCHPKIGDLDSLRMKFAGNRQWSASEQAGISAADERTIQAIAEGNQVYLERFGYIFIVCASGKSADEMLALLTDRFQNDVATELTIAAAEQRKITHLRIDKLFQTETPMRSPITTHILDTTLGRPASGIHVELFSTNQNERRKVGEGTTDIDGRIGAGLIASDDFKPGTYKMRFATGVYFDSQGTDHFYPELTITFKVSVDQSHYHIPLLLSPYGYTTYRGS